MRLPSSIFLVILKFSGRFTAVRKSNFNTFRQKYAKFFQLLVIFFGDLASRDG